MTNWRSNRPHVKEMHTTFKASQISSWVAMTNEELLTPSHAHTMMMMAVKAVLKATIWKPGKVTICLGEYSKLNQVMRKIRVQVARKSVTFGGPGEAQKHVLATDTNIPIDKCFEFKPYRWQG